MALAVLAALVIALGLLWSERRPIARDFVDRRLAAAGVPAQYRIARLGVTSQRLEDIVVGDPRAPDLTADWAELNIAPTLGWPRVSAIRAHGVRLRGRLVGGRLSLGALDRLMPAPSAAPFTLPDLAVDLGDARMRLDTPYGPVGLALSGSGNLADGFSGRLAAVTRALDIDGCRATRATAYLHIVIARRRPALDGPLRAGRIDCRGLIVADANVAVDATLRAALDGWQGNATLRLGGIARGADRVARVAGQVGFAGTAAGTTGTLALAADSLRAGPLAHGRPSLDGRWQLAGAAARLDGSFRLADAGLVPDTARAIAASRDAAAGTPAGPIVQALAPAVAAALDRATIAGELSVERAGARGLLQLRRLALRSASGVIATSAGEGASYRWPAGAARIDGALALSGGGLPATRIRFAPPPAGAMLAGEATVAPFAAGGARLALGPLRFTAGNGAGRFTGAITLDGPLADGRVEGLSLPLEGRFGPAGLVVGERCVALGFTRLAVAGLVLAPARLPLCPERGALLSRTAAGIAGGATIAGPRLSGRIGRAPATIAAARIGVTIGRPGFAADRVAVRIGAGDTVTRLDIASLAGEAAAGGIAGRFAGAGGNIGAVPLLLSEGQGGWRLASAVLTLDGQLRVADRAAAARFNPLVSDDVRLRLEGGRISATGHLSEPRAHAQVAAVTLAHDLSSGVGRAVLDVPGIVFGDALQPEALTPLTLGVIANVQGTISGRGEIRWTADGATSDGRFRSDGLALAAAFGPITGLKGEIRFSDLLALATPPGQVATLGTVNPGVEVRDGVVRYQLLPGQRVRIEGGHWPFSGGELLLEPTLIDFGRPSDRRMTFRITGMDSAKFVEQFELKNMALTGMFDGVLPMVFDDKGGRIVAGRLAVRPGGGTLAYVGEVSNAQLGMFAKLAFDALKAMRYDALTVDLDGALDGELVSRVLFNGTNQSPKAARGGLLSKLTNLPFRFNITIRAPFRGLLNSAVSLNDPRSLIGSAMPGRAAAAPAPVQPQESETVP